ncbi:interleukin-17 receptor E isoform X2 [Phalacrocorax aristotelis]|uniref:interleukin-17 receptor E isoform X2 n=1 Tax=Phalacrocorax aristotelis TaxID=126867 RepID=UPI003F4BCC2A
MRAGVPKPGPVGRRWRSSRGWGVNRDQCVCLSHATALYSRGAGPQPWSVPAAPPPTGRGCPFACRYLEIKYATRSHACLRCRKRRPAAGGMGTGPHVPAEECGGAGGGAGAAAQPWSSRCCSPPLPPRCCCCRGPGPPSPASGSPLTSSAGLPVSSGGAGIGATAIVGGLPRLRIPGAPGVQSFSPAPAWDSRSPGFPLPGAPADRTLSRPRCRQSRPWPGPLLAPPALALSGARLCPPSRPCQPCLRVRLALPAAGLDDVRGLQLNFLELGSNRAGWLQVWRRHRAPGSSPWQVQFDCFPAESGHHVLVSLRTIPDRGLAISHSHLLAPEPPGPVFAHAWVSEERAIKVWVPEGPALMVRLCHQLALECEELPQPFHRQVLVLGGHHVSLPYEFLVPCLCVEASYPHHDSPRSKRCPFRDQPAAYGPELWSSVRFHDYSTSSKDQMVMVLSASCPLRPRATLCWREAAAETAPCHDIPNSTASEEEQAYMLDKVDIHPQLCFRFSYGNSSHVECPHHPETAWNVSVSTRGLQLHLHLTSSVPAAFSAALCQRRSGQCEPEAPLYTVTQLEGSAPGELALLLPVQILGSCVLVWRSDVRFARKQLLCPDVSRRHFGLLGLALALGLVVTVLLLNCRGTWRPAAGAPGGRPVLLLYSPDSEEHLGLVCALAERLRAGLGCDVHLDLWEAGGVGQAGTLPWLYAQRGRVGRQHGTILLLWSRGSAQLFRRWRVGAADGSPRDAHDIFGAAMACLHGELGAAGYGGGWVLAYFSQLCSSHDIPRPLRPLPTYCLPQQLPRLLGALRGSPPAPRRCRGRAEGLLHQLLEVGAREGSPQPPGVAAGT